MIIFVLLIIGIVIIIGIVSVLVAGVILYYCDKIGGLKLDFNDFLRMYKKNSVDWNLYRTTVSYDITLLSHEYFYFSIPGTIKYVAWKHKHDKAIKQMNIEKRVKEIEERWEKDYGNAEDNNDA